MPQATPQISQLFANNSQHCSAVTHMIQNNTITFSVLNVDAQYVSLRQAPGP